jgi:hypothetical protein
MQVVPALSSYLAFMEQLSLLVKKIFISEILFLHVNREELGEYIV